jgi:hypothetical protein
MRNEGDLFIEMERVFIIKLLFGGFFVLLLMTINRSATFFSAGKLGSLVVYLFALV